MQAGRIIPVEHPDTVADGLRTSLGSLTFPIIQRSQQRLDAPGANRIGLFPGANQAGYLVSGGNEMSGNRSADIAGRACAEDLHRSPSGTLTPDAS